MMAEELDNDPVVFSPEATDFKISTRMYYSLAVEKARDVLSSLPNDMSVDLYGLPWEAVMLTAFLGIATFLLFTCRFYQSIKSRLYTGRERKLGQKVAELLEEKFKLLETLSQCKQRFEELESALKNGGVSSHVSERENLEQSVQKLEDSNIKLNNEIEQLKGNLKMQKSIRSQREETLASMQKILHSLEDESHNLKSEMEQAQTTLKIYHINSERLQTNLQMAKEENLQLHESKAQLLQEADGWGECLSELEEEMKLCESSYRAMQEDYSNKDQHIKSLIDCLLKMRDWDLEGEEEDEAITEGSGWPDVTENRDDLEISHGLDDYQKQKVKKLIYAAKMSANLKSLEEDKSRLFVRLADEVKAKEDLQEGIGRIQSEKDQLQVDSTTLTGDMQKLHHKLQIMTEMYQENELKLHRMLTVEERERLQKEEKLNKADRKISLAAEELNTYRQRAQELEEELEKTNQAYKNQITAHEKKAHDNWLAARAAERDLADIKRENANLRQKLTDSQFKVDMVAKDPYVLDASGRTLFRGERSPFGPSPIGRPSSETRAFLSPPTLMDGPLRLSPQFPMGPGGRVSHGTPSLADLPVVSEGEVRGPHSDSGSVSPIWERDRRGPGAPPGYPYPDPGHPYRRFPPGLVPFRVPGPAEAHSFLPHPAEKSGESSGAADGLALSDSRDSLLSVSGELSNPPSVHTAKDSPMIGPTPPLDPRDHLPRRGPYGPPEFFHSRGPPLGMHGLPPPGMFPRFPTVPPQHMGYASARPPSDTILGPPHRPSPPGSVQPPEQPPSAQDII